MLSSRLEDSIKFSEGCVLLARWTQQLLGTHSLCCLHAASTAYLHNLNGLLSGMYYSRTNRRSVIYTGS